MATLLRTESIGLNDFLHRVGVPDVEASCPCGWERQTPNHADIPTSLRRSACWLLRAPRTTPPCCHRSKKGLRAVTSWLIRQGVLPQFKAAREVAEEDRSSNPWGCKDEGSGGGTPFPWFGYGYSGRVGHPPVGGKQVTG